MNRPREVRRATVGDAEQLTAIAIASKQHWGYPAEWMAAWRNELSLTPEYIGAQPVGVALVEREIVGFFGLRFSGDGCRLEHLWLRPSHMGRGFGRELFAEAVREARTAGVTELQIKSDPNTEGFYVRMGARRTGTETCSMPGGLRREIPQLTYSIR